MRYSVNMGKYVIGCLFLSLLTTTLFASIAVSPKFLFLVGSRHSVSLAVTNAGEDEAEVWVDVKYGYEASDDSGKILIHIDSLAVDEPSAAAWIRAYPQRFVVGPGETQTIRIAVRPPAGLADGEYWARIFITSKPRNISSAPVAAKTTTPRSGVNVLTQLSLPFHYRVGKVSTGLQVADINTSLSDTAAVIAMKLTRTGNAAYWGTRTLKFINESGKTVLTVTKNLSVYKTMTIIDKIGRAGLAGGTYSVEIEFVTGKRLDVPISDLVQSPPLHAAASVLITN